MGAVEGANMSLQLLHLLLLFDQRCLQLTPLGLEDLQHFQT